jgi:tetratricopeptide (TPR) repeat protein
MNSNPSSLYETESVNVAVSILLVAAIVSLLVALSRSPELANLESARSEPSAANQDPRAHAEGWRQQEIANRFQQAVMMLHAGQYEYAIVALHRVIALAPRMPEAYVNMGYALLGLKQYAAARDFFQAAIDIYPYQGNAYWGMAVVSEQLNDLPAALGAMRTYIHLAPSDSRSENYVRRARAAIWEWDNSLKRGPLPPEEAQWIAKREREWDERDGPARDMPQSPSMDIKVPAPDTMMLK